MSIPEAGADAINLAELLADIDEFLPVENLTLSPAVSLYFDENLPQGIESLKLTAETNNGATKRHLLQGADIQGFAPLANLDQRAPVLTGNEYSGPLPPAALSLDSGALIDLLHEKPGDLRLAFDVKLADPTTITFSDDAADNTLAIAPDILLDLPLEFKIKAGPSTDYAAIKLVNPDDKGQDLFGRSSAAAPLVDLGGITLEEIKLSLEYRNTLGLAADLALVSTGFDGQENFRKIIPLRSGGSGTISLNLKHSELPFPFRLGFETLLPANIQEGADKYAVLKIIPGGIINISKLRIDQLDLGLTGNL